MYFSCMSDDPSSDTQSPPKKLNAITPWRQSPGAPGVARTPRKVADTKRLSAPESSRLSAITSLKKTIHPSQGSYQRLTASWLEKGLQEPPPSLLPSQAGTSAGLLLSRFCVCNHRHSGKKRILVLPCPESTTSLQMFTTSGSHGLSVSSSLMVPEPFGEEI